MMGNNAVKLFKFFLQFWDTSLPTVVYLPLCYLPCRCVYWLTCVSTIEENVAIYLSCREYIA